MLKAQGNLTINESPNNGSHDPANRIILQKTVRLDSGKEPGILALTNSRLLWTHNNQPKLSMLFVEIKNISISKAQAGKPPILRLSKNPDPQSPDSHIFHFLSATSEAQALKDRDEVRDLIQSSMSAIKKNNALSGAKTDGKAKDLDVKTPARPAITESEIQQRANLLTSNAELKSLHEQLVKTGVISDDEFWDSRKQMVQSEILKQQDKGMPSALVSDVRPDKKTPGTVHYKLTPTIIHQIFVEKPAVEKLYKENVPYKMTEQLFWTKYFESLHFHKENKKATISTQPVDEEFNRAAAEEPTDIEPIIVKRKLTNIDPTVDISADLADNSLGQSYGAKVDSHQDPQKLIKSLTLIRRLNRHGALVLGSSYDSKPSKKQKVEEPLNERLRLGDLEEDKPESVVPLTIENPRLYFEGRTTNVTDVPIKTEKLPPQEQIKIFQFEVANWTSNLQRAIVPESLGATILQEIAQKKSSLRDNNSVGSEAELSSLPDDFKFKLKTFFLQANEFLRHFWSVFPIKNNKAYDKAKKLIDAISKLYDDIQKYCTSLSSEKRGLGQIMFPITQSLDKAIDKYNNTKYP